MTTALGIIYLIGMGFFQIVFLGQWIGSPKVIRKYLKYGIGAGLTVVGLDLLMVATTPSSQRPTLFLGLIAEPIFFLKQVGFTMLGMYYLVGLGYPSLPLFLRKFGVASDESNTDENTGDNQADTCPETTDSIQQARSTLHEVDEQVYASNKSHSASDLLLDINWRDYFLTIFGVSIIATLYSAVLFLLTAPQLSGMLQTKVIPPSVGFHDPDLFKPFWYVWNLRLARK